jgi:hypothetical protein
MSIEAMKMALEALEKPSWSHAAAFANIKEAITVLRQAIAEAEKQEPVAWVECDGELVWNNREAAIGRNLYTAPPPRQPWIGLTDEEQQELYDAWIKIGDGWGSFYALIEVKLKEKNT